MKQTETELKQYKEVKRALLRNGEEVAYVVVEKAPDGRLAKVIVGEWITTNAVKELQEQARLYQLEVAKVEEDKRKQDKLTFEKKFSEAETLIRGLEKQVKFAQLEIKFIKGEITEEDYLKGKEELK